MPSGPFFGFTREGAKVSQGLIQSWWSQGMMCGFKNAYDCIKVFFETDMTGDLQKMRSPCAVHACRGVTRWCRVMRARRLQSSWLRVAG